MFTDDEGGGKKTSEVSEGLCRRWCEDRALRPARRSHGRPGPSQVVQEQFRATVRHGRHDVGGVIDRGHVVAGWCSLVSPGWRHAADLVGRAHRPYRTFEDREQVVILRAKDKGVREIAHAVGCHPGTESRELRRKAATRWASKSTALGW